MKPLLLALLTTATLHAVPVQITFTDPPNTGFSDPAARTPTGSNPGTTLGQQRQIAFQYAVSRWAAQISGTIPLRIRAVWYSTPPSGGLITLANASPVNFFKNSTDVSGLPRNETFFPSALVDQVMGLDLVFSGTSDDIVVNCNSYLDEVTTDGFVWNYGIDGSSSSGTSFVGTILHEIGHGLGFISGLNSGNGTYGMTQPYIWDALMTDGSGTFLTSMSAASRVPLVTGNNLFSDGPTTRLYNNGNPARINAPATFSAGSSLHHYDETTYSATGSINELMTPLVSFPTHMFGPLVTSAMRDMGYTMADTLSPNVDVVSPASGRSYTSAALAGTGVFGTANDTSAGGSSNAVGLLRARVALFSHTAGKWYRWSTSSFNAATFNYNDHTQNAPIDNLLPVTTGSHTWRATLPAGLADGSYDLQVSAVDQNDQGSPFVSTTFTIDNSAPGVVIEPWADGDTIHNLNGLNILAGDATSVSFEMKRPNGAGWWYWTGTNWSSSSYTLTTSSSGGRWYPTAALPGRADWPQGQAITIAAHATDAASNTTHRQITVYRTAADTTLPVVTIQAINGPLAYPSLPALQGTASDPQTGISSVSLSLARFLTGGGIVFWDGTSWSASPGNLPVIHDPADGKWTAPAGWNLPSGSNLPNGSYSLQVTATNGESPGGTSGVGTGFTVDYHPVYLWTGWTMRDDNPNNNSDSWGTPENWSPYGVPDVNDIAEIANGDTVTSSISRSVHAMRLYSGNLTFTNGPGPSGTLTTGSASIWNGGSLYGIWANNGPLALGGTYRKLDVSSQLVNAGTVTWTSGITLGQNTSSIRNLSGATWILAGTGDVFDNYYGGNQFINQGVLRQTSGGQVDFNDWYYTLGGEIQRQGGVLTLYADSAVPDGSQFTGNGAFRMLGGNMTTTGGVQNAGGLFEFSGGTWIAGSASTLTGSYLWSGGGWSGVFTVPMGSDLSITGDCRLNTSAVLNNQGTVRWNSASPLNGYNNVTVNNAATGVWRLESAGNAFSNYYGGNVFNNQGRLEKTANATTVLQEWSYILPGETRSNAGILTVSATSSLPAGAVLSGAGTLDLAGGDCALGGEITSTLANLKFSGGQLVCSAGAKIQGDWLWSGGSVSGPLEVPVTRRLTLNGYFQLNTSASLLNKGQVLWQGPGPLVGYNNTTVTNAPGATWELAYAGQAFANYYGGNHFHNQGLLTRTAPTGEVLLSDWSYHHSGVLNAGAGSTRMISTLELLSGSSLTGAGAVSLQGDVLLKGPTTFSAPTTVDAGNFTGEAAGLVNGTLRWNSGTFYGVTKIASGAFLRLVGTTWKTLAANSDIDVSGELVLEQGDLTGYNTSRFVVRSGGVLRYQGPGALTNYYSGNRVVIESGGSFIKTNNGDNGIDWAFDNRGTASVNAGTLILNGGGSSNGVFSGNSGGVLRFANGTQVLEAGATLTGGVESTGGALLASGNSGGRIDVKDGTVGSLPPAVFTFSGSSTWTGGWLAGNTLIPSGSSLSISSGNFKSLAESAVLATEGLLQWNGGHPIQGHNTSTIDVRSSGTFRTTADGDLFSTYYGGNRLLLSGVLEKTAGSTSTFIDEWLVEGNGVIRPQVANIEFNTNVNLLPGTRFEGAGRPRFLGWNTTVQGTSTINPGSVVEFAGASMIGHADGTGTFAGGAIDWTAGWLNGVLTLASGTTVSGSGEKWIGGYSTVRNSGILTVSGSGPLNAYENSILRNMTGGSLTCTGSNHFGNYHGGNRLINDGTMNMGASPRRQTMDWAFEQSPTGRLNIEVAGANAAIPEFDILQTSSTVQLAGTLGVTKLNGYNPPVDTTFAFITSPGITGTFATVQASGFTAEYHPNDVTLRASASGMTYENWTTAHGLAGQDAQPKGDADHDGVVNFLEYAFNTNPAVTSPSPVTSSVITVDGQRWLTLRYRRWQSRLDSGLGYFPERSANLSAWDNSGLIDETDPDAAVVPDSEARRCRVPAGTGKSFLRIRVE